MTEQNERNTPTVEDRERQTLFVSQWIPTESSEFRLDLDQRRKQIENKSWIEFWRVVTVSVSAIDGLESSLETRNCDRKQSFQFFRQTFFCFVWLTKEQKTLFSPIFDSNTKFAINQWLNDCVTRLASHSGPTIDAQTSASDTRFANQKTRT